MVTPIGSGSGAYDTAVAQQMRSLAADRLLKRIDANQDGKITVAELSTALEASGSNKGPSAAEILKQLDQGNKGYITKQDLESGLAKAEQGNPAQAPPRMGRGGGGGGGGESTATSTAYSFDPQDLNQDGVVTMQEKIQFVQNLYAAQKEAESGNQAPVYA